MSFSPNPPAHPCLAQEIIQPLTGSSGGSFLLNQAGQLSLLRQQLPQLTKLGVDRQHEYQILIHLAQHNFPAPRVLAKAPAQLQLAWIEGNNPAQWDPALLNQLAQQLAQLHQLPLSCHLPKLQLNQRYQFLLAQLTPAEQSNFPRTPHFPQQQYCAIAHHDLHLGNLIVNKGKLLLIDWEYSAISEPALELAFFFASNPLKVRQRNYFLRQYFSYNKALTYTQQEFCTRIQSFLPNANLFFKLWQQVQQQLSKSLIICP